MAAAQAGNAASTGPHDGACSKIGSSPRTRAAETTGITGRAVHIDLPSASVMHISPETFFDTITGGIGLNPADLAVATAVKAVSGHSNSAYYIISGAAGAASGVCAVPRPASINVRKVGGRVSASGSENSSPRAEWRQKFRLASDTMQLNADAFPGKGFSSSSAKARPSSAPRASSLQHAFQVPSPSISSETAANEAETHALVKGYSVKVTMQALKAADAGITVVPAPSLL